MRKPFNGKAKITSIFGMRTHPIYKTKKFHNGLDIVIEDRKIVCCETGIVVHSAYSRTAGNWVVVRHTSDLFSCYMHMSKPSKLRVGDSVKEGDFIGYQGNTGKSAGSHLHFQFRNKNWGSSKGNEDDKSTADIIGVKNKIGDVEDIEKKPKVEKSTMKLNLFGKDIIVEGYLIDDKFQTPLRDIFEQINCEVNWTPELTTIKPK